MMVILLTVIIVFALIAVSVLLLPVKLFFTASGGSDSEIALSGRIMLFNGLFGG